MTKNKRKTKKVVITLPVPEWMMLKKVAVLAHTNVHTVIRVMLAIKVVTSE